MSSKLSILIIEDEENIAGFIASMLNAHDYKTIITKTAEEGLSMIASHCPSLIILDLGLPDMDGMEVLKNLRKWSEVPVIIISARTHESEKVLALDAGADDYITKPFGASELLARIRTTLRHTMPSEQKQLYKCGRLLIDFNNRTVMLGKEHVHLTQIEYKIVTLLAQNAGKVLTYDKIITSIWGPYADTNNRILRVNMVSIRRKIETNPANPKYIFTEVGVGYRMSEGESGK